MDKVILGYDNSDVIEVGYRLPTGSQNSLDNQLVAVSRSLARTLTNWSPTQKKLFVMCLTKIKWSRTYNLNEIELKKSEIMEKLGSKIDSDHTSTYLRDLFSDLTRKSEIRWTDPRDKNIWSDGNLIINRRSTRNYIYVTFNPYFMPHLENLCGEKSFITAWSNDIYKFNSRFSFALFENLRLYYDSTKFPNERDYTTKQLKELFNLSKEDYVRKNGKFDRAAFEKNTLNVALKEINDGEMLKILKIYKIYAPNRQVTHYRIRYMCNTKLISKDEYDSEFID